MDNDGNMSSRGAPERSAESSSGDTIERESSGDIERPMIPSGRFGQNPNSFRVVLESMYVSARDIAIERPITMSGTPPINFGVVAPGLYRSGYPQAADYPFMRGLGLRTIVTLVGKNMPDGYQAFIDGTGINHQIFDMAGTKKEEIPLSMMKSIAAVVLDPENYPLLIHCNQGKHRTGCVVGIIRKQSAWDVNAIIQEYTDYAAPKIRMSDIAYIRNFRVSDVPSVKAELLPKPKPSSVTIGTFVSFIFIAFFALFIWIYSGSRLLMTAPPRRDRPLRRNSGILGRTTKPDPYMDPRFA